MMETIQVNNDLRIEVSDGDPPTLRLVSASLEADGEAPESVILFPHEIGALREALAEAAGVAAAMVAGEHDGPVLV
jgi:hypothetical protein